MLDDAVVGARLLQYTCLLLLFGLPCFVLHALSREQAQARFWHRLQLGVSLAGALALLLWLMAQAALLDDQPADALRWQALGTLVQSTRFGHLQALRIGWLVVSTLLLFSGSSRRAWQLQALLGGALLASLAWSGHGHIDEGAIGALHLAADATHLLAAGIWLGALAGLCLLLARASADAPVRLWALERFSAIGIIVVALLLLSGIVNSVLLIGAGHWHELGTSGWGRTLLWKLLLFGLMLLLAAINRYRLSPRLRTGSDQAAWPAVRSSVLLETVLGLLVIAAVSLLGTLPPPVSG